ncbi:MAG: hypothetical protein ACUVS7_17610 [Bryobacteraceae bacterium]
MQAIHRVRTVPKIAMVFDVHPDFVANRKRQVFGLPPADLQRRPGPTPVFRP